ncbi:glycosyltransferase family 2 protein [Nitrosomonas sp.]|uniref:glycosyltransferase family 2 protein n=1 Tax=Nitrosomonas sp. TaxID=42353 RepID=UPI001D308DF3|nr:glycosyltransferase [Nitrosomonas sp.]MBX3615774.1 glycosyltransferase [Nitrosomonas sp.]
MSNLITPIIDVVIPVYNAPELTRRCIDSVVAHLGASIRTIHIQNDASAEETRTMLDRLTYPQVQIFHAPVNQGYGRSVNDAMARSDAELVLVLNSDSEVTANFLPLLCNALAADSKLAVINPTEGEMPRGTANRYLQQPGGYIETYRFRGYAFLIRHAVFQALGGFDVQFERGYYEDTDLGRRLEQQGWRMGIHPQAAIKHKIGASFGRGRPYLELVRKNRNLYLSRYPRARQNVLVVSGVSTLTGLPLPAVDAIEQVMRQGGRVEWLTPESLPQLSCLQMRNSKIRSNRIIKLMVRGWSRKDKRVTDLWFFPGTAIWLRWLLRIWARLRGIRIREWEAAVS